MNLVQKYPPTIEIWPQYCCYWFSNKPRMKIFILNLQDVLIFMPGLHETRIIETIEKHFAFN